MATIPCNNYNEKKKCEKDTMAWMGDRGDTRWFREARRLRLIMFLYFFKQELITGGLKRRY